MRIAICNDDERELHHLSELLTMYQSDRRGSVDWCVYSNGTDFLCEMRGGEYDLVLLDILMPGINGIQVARELRERDQNVRIILLSSTPEFAVESYNVGAYHYLLKPADSNLLFQLLDKVEDELTVQEEQGFLLRNREGVFKIVYTNLEYVEVINKTVFFYLTDGVIYEVSGSLTDFEEKFSDRADFVKTHRAYLVNLGCVRSIDANFVVTRSGHRIPVSRPRRKQVRETYMSFMHRAEEMADAYSAEKTVRTMKGSEAPWRILLIDDDLAEHALWAKILQNHGCVVQMAQNGFEALQLMGEETYDCVLLDVLIPGEDGFSLCEKIHKAADVPVIFLSCLTDADARLKALRPVV